VPPLNPHLFVGRVSAPRLVPVGKQFPWKGTTLRPQALREDRILQEIHATGGDVRRICDLFGITIETAMRYTLSLAHPDLRAPSSQLLEPEAAHRIDAGVYPPVRVRLAPESGN